MKVLKPGYKTSEFIALVALNVGTVAASLQGSLAPNWATIAGIVSVSAFALSRGLAKAGPTVPGK